MFIRSQNKKILVDTNKIYIECDSIYNHKTYFIKGDCILGQYSKKEKAMKVMDMIHDQIMLGSLKYEDVKSNDNNQQWLKSEFVFQMPKDEVVK